MLVLLAIATAIFTSTPTVAQMVCMNHVEVVAKLKDLHKEQSAAMGLTASGRVVELFTAKDGGWTLVQTLPNGMSCLISAGEDWVETAPVKSSKTSALGSH
jgi:hypothetical protein